MKIVDILKFSSLFDVLVASDETRVERALPLAEVDNERPSERSSEMEPGAVEAEYDLDVEFQIDPKKILEGDAGEEISKGIDYFSKDNTSLLQFVDIPLFVELKYNIRTGDYHINFLKNDLKKINIKDYDLWNSRLAPVLMMSDISWSEKNDLILSKQNAIKLIQELVKIQAEKEDEARRKFFSEQKEPPPFEFKRFALTRTFRKIALRSVVSVFNLPE
jgi:hypothetical protein